MSRRNRDKRKLNYQRKLVEPNGTSPKVIATFTIKCDEHGNTHTHIDGPFPIVALNLALDLAKLNGLTQMQLQMQRQQQPRSRVFLPDGSLPPASL